MVCAAPSGRQARRGAQRGGAAGRLWTAMCRLTLSHLVSACLGKNPKKSSLPYLTLPSSGRGRASAGRGGEGGQATAVTVPKRVRLSRRARRAVPVRAMQMPCVSPMNGPNGSFPIARRRGRQGEMPRSTTTTGKYSRDTPASRLESATRPGDLADGGASGPRDASCIGVRRAADRLRRSLSLRVSAPGRAAAAGSRAPPRSAS